MSGLNVVDGITRNEFICGAGALAALEALPSAARVRREGDEVMDYARLQAEVDAVSPRDFEEYLAGRWDWFGLSRKAALSRLEAAFSRVLSEVKTTVVTDSPAVWFVYNMGIVVKTRESCFAVDLMHRRAPELAPFLDFAVITHNHFDHYSEAFYAAMDDAGKLVVSNFKDNYGAVRLTGSGGYLRGNKTLKLKDVEICAYLTDHNEYLTDFTTAFEFKVGDWVLFHSGDCSNGVKLQLAKRPDLWVFHPYCGLEVADGLKIVNPQRLVIAHLNELSHWRGRWRWSWQDGLTAKAAAAAAGGTAIMPFWGERIQ